MLPLFFFINRKCVNVSLIKLLPDNHWFSSIPPSHLHPLKVLNASANFKVVFHNSQVYLGIESNASLDAHSVSLMQREAKLLLVDSSGGE